MKRSCLFLGLLALLLPCLIAGSVPAPLTHANTTAPAAPGAVVITVDTAVDSNEVAYRACTAAPADCSLRGAISRANADPAYEYSVLLPSGTYTLTLAGVDEDANATGDLDVVTGTLTIDGVEAASTVVDAGGLDRVLHVHANAVVTVTGVSFTNGRLPDGAGSRHGGGVYNAGALHLSHSAVYSNTSRVGAFCSGSMCIAGDGGDGGGVFNNGTLEVVHSAVYSNITGAGGACSGTTCDAGYGGDGAGLYNSGTLEVFYSTVYSNTTGVPGSCSGTACEEYDGGAGGGVYNHTGSVQLANVTFSGNHAHAYGGGMSTVFGSPQLAQVAFNGNRADYSGGGMMNWVNDPHLANVTFSGNQAYSGGGMENWDSDPQLVNVTFSGNHANWGGGMSNSQSSPQLVNVTFSGNHANASGGGMYNTADPGYPKYPGVFNCILWGNTAPVGSQMANYWDATPVISYSLVQGGCPPGSNCDANLLDADPQFLRDPDPGDGDWTTPGDNDYGDLRLHYTSPAIDKGDNTALPADTLDLDGDGDTAEPIPLDLDGRSRVIGPAVDMGAYETPFRIYLPVVSK